MGLGEESGRDGEVVSWEDTRTVPKSPPRVRPVPSLLSGRARLAERGEDPAGGADAADAVHLPLAARPDVRRDAALPLHDGARAGHRRRAHRGEPHRKQRAVLGTVPAGGVRHHDAQAQPDGHHDRPALPADRRPRADRAAAVRPPDPERDGKGEAALPARDRRAQREPQREADAACRRASPGRRLPRPLRAEPAGGAGRLARRRPARRAAAPAVCESADRPSQAGAGGPRGRV
mmetsp:Transcript_37523/g.118083  ORF Transcript_37523/g.118083 Transcript_37523/m.118083 type:complete len:234 (+) Transcript_37523:89-790(+)